MISWIRRSPAGGRIFQAGSDRLRPGPRWDAKLGGNTIAHEGKQILDIRIILDEFFAHVAHITFLRRGSAMQELRHIT
jgi:type 1 glutamine amidotransferase